MIIPIRCFTCGKIVAPIYCKYIDECKKFAKSKESESILEKSKKGELMDKLNIKRLCCRTLFLSHVELIDIIEP